MTDFSFYEIYTSQVRLLQQPLRRLPNNDMRTVVVTNIDKLVNLKIKRLST